MQVIEMKSNQISKAHRIEVYKSLFIILTFPSFQILQIQKTSTLSTKTLNLQNHILKGTTIYIFLYLHCCFFLFWSSPHTVSSTPLKHQTEKKHVNKHQKNVTSYEMEEEKNHQATSRITPHPHISVNQWRKYYTVKLSQFRFNLRKRLLQRIPKCKFQLDAPEYLCGQCKLAKNRKIYMLIEEINKYYQKEKRNVRSYNERGKKNQLPRSKTRRQSFMKPITFSSYSNPGFQTSEP